MALVAERTADRMNATNALLNCILEMRIVASWSVKPEDELISEGEIQSSGELENEEKDRPDFIALRNTTCILRCKLQTSAPTQK